MTIENMVVTVLLRNGGQGLHVGLAGMLVTNCKSPKVTLLIFSVLIFIVVSNASSSSLHLKHDLGQLSRQLLQPPVGSNAGVGETQTRYQSVATLNQY